MAIDSRDKRASCIGFGLPPLAVLPRPEGSVSFADRWQLGYAYRLLDTGGLQIFIRRVTDYSGISDVLLTQRLRTQQTLDTFDLDDLVNFDRLRQVWAPEILLVDDIGASVRERNQSIGDTLETLDPFLVDRNFTRRLIDAIGIHDYYTWIYLPYIMNYKPIRGIRIGEEILHRARFRMNLLGLVLDGTPSSIGRSRGGLYPARMIGSIISAIAEHRPLGVQIGMQRISRGNQKRPM